MEGWDSIEDADVLRDPEASIIGHANDGEEASALDDSSTRVPIGMSEPAQPSKAENRNQNLQYSFLDPF